MTAFAKKKSVHKSTVSRAIKAARGKSRRKTKKPLLSTKTKAARVEHGRRILNDLKHSPGCRTVRSSKLPRCL